MAGPVKAFNHAQGSAAAVVGPARSRIRQIVIYADAAGAFTIKDGKRFRCVRYLHKPFRQVCIT